MNTKIRVDFEQFFVTKQGVFSLQKVQKISVFEYNGYNVYLTKAEVGHFHCSLKTRKYKFCPNFHTCLK